MTQECYCAGVRVSVLPSPFKVDSAHVCLSVWLRNLDFVGISGGTHGGAVG